MVSCQEMEGQVLGFQRGKEVVLNEHLLREEGSVFQKTFYDKGGVLTTRQEVEEAAGWKMMELLFHIDAYHLLESKGIKATKENYMQALTDKDLHRIQPSEAKAYEVSFERTLAVIEQVETSAGVPDADAEKYRKCSSAVRDCYHCDDHYQYVRNGLVAYCDEYAGQYL